MNKPTQEQFITAYRALPTAIKEFLADPDQLAKLLTEIWSKYQLHIDIAGKINESIGYLLVGLAGPSALMQELSAAGITEADSRQIINEINEKIFVPLRDQMRTGTSDALRPAPQPIKPVTPPVAEFPRGNYAPPPQSPRYVRPVNETAPVDSPRSQAVMPVQPSPAPVPAAPQPPAASINRIQRSMSDDRLLEDHEEPHIDLNTMPPAPARTAPPPANLPGAPRTPESFGEEPIPPRPAYVPPMSPAPQPTFRQPEPTPPNLPPIAPKPYSADPYREPIDEENNG